MPSPHLNTQNKMYFFFSKQNKQKRLAGKEKFASNNKKGEMENKEQIF